MKQAVILLLASVGCYSANPAIGVPCAADKSCPSGQFCDLSRDPPLCVTSSLDAAIDSAIACTTSSNSCPVDAPICDTASMTCRRCVEDADCTSGVCYESVGTCIDSSIVIYVDGATGDDNGECTDAIPCRTISHALAHVDATRSFMRIAPGEYAQSAVINSSVVLSGTSRMADTKLKTLSIVPVLTVNGTGTVVTVETLQITSSPGAGIDVNNATTVKLFGMVLDGLQSGVNAQATRLEVRQSTFTGNNRAIEVSNNATLLVNRSTMRGSRDQVIRITSSNYAITSSLFVDNERSINLEKQQGIITALFDHNTVVGTTNDFAVRCNSADTAITNSIFASNRPPSIDTNRCTVRYTLASDMLAPGIGNLTGDPGFVGATDLHLGPASKAIDTADPQSTEPVDFDGQPRPRGQFRDMGAYER